MATKTTETLKQLTYLAGALKAPRILDVAGRLADQARDAGWTFEDYLAAVLEREVSARNASGAELRIRAAGFGARKTLEDFDFDAQPAVRNQVAALASGGFLTEARNVVLLGPPGTGKTHLAIALGITACRHGHRALFATATDWVTRLSDAHRAGRLPAELVKLRRYGLIIIDEVGYLPFEQDAANLFFQLVSSRYEHASLVLTSNPRSDSLGAGDIRSLGTDRAGWRRSADWSASSSSRVGVFWVWVRMRSAAASTRCPVTMMMSSTDVPGVAARAAQPTT